MLSTQVLVRYLGLTVIVGAMFFFCRNRLALVWCGSLFLAYGAYAIAFRHFPMRGMAPAVGTEAVIHGWIAIGYAAALLLRAALRR